MARLTLSNRGSLSYVSTKPKMASSGHCSTLLQKQVIYGLNLPHEGIQNPRYSSSIYNYGGIRALRLMGRYGVALDNVSLRMYT